MDMPAANHSELDCLNHKNYFVSLCTLIVFLFISPISVEMKKKELRSAARFIILNHLIRFLIVCLVYMDAEEFSIFSDHFSLLEQNREVHSMQVWALEINRRNKRFMQ